MRGMQNFHQVERGWNDIGYSFAIGGDGKVYHGRGFNVVGAHAPRYNAKSIGICMIGDWRSNAIFHQKISLKLTWNLIASNFTPHTSARRPYFSELTADSNAGNFKGFTGI